MQDRKFNIVPHSILITDRVDIPIIKSEVVVCHVASKILELHRGTDCTDDFVPAETYCDNEKFAAIVRECRKGI